MIRKIPCFIKYQNCFQAFNHIKLIDSSLAPLILCNALYKFDANFCYSSPQFENEILKFPNNSDLPRLYPYALQPYRECTDPMCSQSEQSPFNQ